MSYKNQLSSRFKNISANLFSKGQTLLYVLISTLQSLYRIIRRFSKFIPLIFDQTLGTVPSLIRANRILRSKILNLQVEGITDSDPRLQLPIDHLKDHFKLEIERLDRIEDKARSTVLGVGIAISLATPSVLLPTRTTTFANEPLYFKLLLTIAIGLAVAFLLMSGFFALTAYKVGEISFPRIDNHPSLVSEDKIREDLVLIIDLNVLRIIQKANLLSASMDCLRNGLLLFFLVLAVSLLTVF